MCGVILIDSLCFFERISVYPIHGGRLSSRPLTRPISASGSILRPSRYSHSISIVTGGGKIRLLWMPGSYKAGGEVAEYRPQYDMLVTHINWDQFKDGLYYIPKAVQCGVYEGDPKHYLNIPVGTNHRGAELPPGPKTTCSGIPTPSGSRYTRSRKGWTTPRTSVGKSSGKPADCRPTPFTFACGSRGKFTWHIIPGNPFKRI